MTNKERGENMERCAKFDWCSASICPLDPLAEGCYVQGDKVCPLIKDFLEGKRFPLMAEVKATESAWRFKLSEKLLTRQIKARQTLREYWAKIALKTNRMGVLSETAQSSNSKSLDGNFIQDYTL